MMRELSMMKLLKNGEASIVNTIGQRNTFEKFPFGNLPVVLFACYFPSAKIIKQGKEKFLALLILFLMLSTIGISQIVIRSLHTVLNSTTDALSFTSPSYQPRRNTVLLGFVINSKGTANNATSRLKPSGASGNGLTWTEIANTPYATNYQITVFRAATGSTSTAGGFTVNFPGSGGQARQNCIIQVLELNGVDVSGTNGANAIAQIITATGSNSNPTINLAAISDCGSGVIGVFGNDIDPFNATPETGFTEIFDVGNSNIDIGGYLSYATNTTDNTVRVTRGNSNWGGIAIQLNKAETYSNFPCVSTSAASNGQTFTSGANQVFCINGTANNLQLNTSSVAGVVVAKANTLTFSSVNMSNGSSFIVDQGATVNFPATSLNTADLTIANGGSFIASSFTLNNTSAFRVYGQVVINGDVTLNNPNALIYLGPISSLTITGTLTINSGQVLLDGGSLNANTLVTRSGSGIQICQGGNIVVNRYLDNNQANVFSTGAGGGCLGAVGPAGQLGPSTNNSFQAITANNALKLCIPSSEVTVTSFFNAGSATVFNNCGGCASVLSMALLPIQLLSFTGVPKSNAETLLEWKVADNHEVGYLTLETSRDGRVFSTMAQIKKNVAPTYYFKHIISEPGVYFYKLKMSDIRGKTSYSNTISIVNGTSPSTQIFGPVNNMVNSNMLQIKMYAGKNQQVQYSISDISGRVAARKKVFVQRGMNQWAISLQEFAKGMYFIQIDTEDLNPSTFKFVKE